MDKKPSGEEEDEDEDGKEGLSEGTMGCMNVTVVCKQTMTE